MDHTTSEDVIHSGNNDTINTVIGDEPPSLEDRLYNSKGNALLTRTDTSPGIIDCGDGGKVTVFFDAGGDV
jgi:hypothetical protein